MGVRRHRTGRARGLGFTLVEVLVTTIVVGVMAAVVVPAIVKQMNSADPARMASDLQAIKVGVQLFHVDLKPRFPGDLEDLVNGPATSGDLGIDGTTYSQSLVNAWRGPYLQRQLAAADAATGTAWSISNVGNIENDLKLCQENFINGCPPPDHNAGSLWVTVQLTAISEAEFNALNDIIDGEEVRGEQESWGKGLLRYISSTATASFLVVPYTAP